jgi:hypothetical protein
MNVIYRNNTTYLYESYWRESIDSSQRDSNGKRFPFPKEGNKYWTDKEQFKNKLESVENYLKQHDNFSNEYKNKDCLLCDAKNITSGTFNLNNIIWEDGLKHYIEVHNVKPSNIFIERIYQFNPPYNSVKRTMNYKSKIYKMEDIQYLKLERNQIMIMDALMRHGGYARKYIDKKNRKLYRYSEHAGLLDFNNNGLEKIIISGKTNRVDVGDEEIFLPKNMPDAIDYEYLFHTHPPTPKPGGRADIGILYEFPSISDLYHFMDHFNAGETQGSLVIAPEGMYNIRKKVFDRKKIKINEDKLFDSMRTVMRNAQKEAIEKYGIKFTSYDFFSKISQNTKYINMINKELNKYELHIDFYSRIKDDTGKWVIDTVYLPIYVIERK